MNAFAFNLALFLDRLAETAPPCVYGLGICLLARKLLPVPAWLTPGLLAAACVLAIAVLLAIRTLRRPERRYGEEYARAWLDLRNRAGGKIISSSSDAPRPAILPAASPRHLCLSLIWPAVFLAAAFLAPAPSAGDALSGANLTREIARLEREIDEAREAGALAEPDAQSMLRQLQRMREMAEQDPRAAAEALASLPGRLEEARTSRMELTAEAMEKAAAVRDGQATDGGAGSAGAGEEWERRVEEYRKSLETLARAEGGVDAMRPELGGALRDALERLEKPGQSAARDGGGASRADGAESAEKLLKALDARAEELVRADRRTGGGAGSAATARGLASSRLQTLSESLAGRRTAAGSGGLERGRGDAPLAFGRESQKGDREVEYIPLPPGGADAGDLPLWRERTLPDAALPPEEFRAPGARTALPTGEVRAGRGGAGPGPGREKAVRNYFGNFPFESMENSRGRTE